MWKGSIMRSFIQYLEEKKSFTADEAKKIGDSMSLDWSKYDKEQFRKGLEVETEHDGGKGKDVDVVKNNKDLAKIVMAHLRELPDYYDRLEKMEKEK